MTKEEFETIIKPLMLLDGKQCQFMRSALLGNFQKWNEQKQSFIADVSNTFFCGVDGGYCPMERKKDKKCLADFDCINQVTK